MRHWTENQIELVLIRHGATKSNEEKRYLGRTDEELSLMGRKVLQQKKEQSVYPEVERLYGSPMKRCRQTAELLYPELCMVPVAEWTEMDFGAFEGKNYRELQKDARYQAFIDSNGTLPFPDGESREAFIQRCRKGLCRMLEMEGADPQKRIGLIVHGGTIMALLSSYAGNGYFDYQVPVTEGFLCRLFWSEDGAFVKITDVRRLGEMEDIL